jgi:hypothetical protein
MAKATGILLVLALALQLGLGCGLARALTLGEHACCATECPMNSAQHARNCCSSSTRSENMLAGRATTQVPQITSTPLRLDRFTVTLRASAPSQARILPTASPPLIDILCSRQI